MSKLEFVFVGGVPRSGTSLIQKILDSNSRVYAGPEFDFLPMLCKVYSKMKKGAQSGRQIFYYDEPYLKAAFSSFINNLFERKAASEGVTVVSEKTPGNVLAFEQLKELFPTARFIFVVRDPRANVNSFRKVAQRAGEFGDSVSVGKNIMQDVGLINRYIRTGNDFYMRNKDVCHLVSYEALIQSPQDEIKKLCDFIKIPFEEQMLNPQGSNDSSKLVNDQHRSVRAWSTPGMLNKGIDPASLWAWKEELSRSHRLFINRFFSNTSYTCYHFFVFERPKWWEQLFILPIYLRNINLNILRRSWRKAS